MKKHRLIAFTDNVLTIIMTILVLKLNRPSSPTLVAFWALRQNYFAYFLSFLWLGSLFIALNEIWEKVEFISSRVIYVTLLLSFTLSFLPYTTGLVSTYFDSRVVQALYGTVVINSTICNWYLHYVIDKVNLNNQELLTRTKEYRKLLVLDLGIKLLGLILTIFVNPHWMMYSVLIAAGYSTFMHMTKMKKIPS